MNSVLAVLLLPCTAAALFGADLEELRSTLSGRIERGKAVGIVAGVIDPQGRKVIALGRVAQPGSPAPDGDTVFEIGSITKVFTSLLLADMVERGEVKLDDPISKYLPAGITIPQWPTRPITLVDLSMQISGLPRLPSNLKPADPENPYADYDVATLYRFLASYTLMRQPGERYEYSNLGAGLLGHVLSLRAGMSYEELLRRRVLEPLGMTSTSLTLSEPQKKRLSPGHDAGLQQVKNWDFDSLAGCGAIRSTANDMLKFLAANMGLTDTPLKPAMQRMRTVHKDTGIPDLQVELAWHVFHRFKTELVWHNGGTGGYRSFAGFDPATKRGIVILCNTFLDNDDVGFHALNSQYPLAKITDQKVRTEIEVAPAILESYVGVYELAPSFSLTVTNEHGRLLAQATNQPRFELFAEKENEFFLKAVDAQITFDKDPAGKVTQLVLHQGGRNVAGRKVK